MTDMTPDQEIYHLTVDVEQLQDELEDTRSVVCAIISYMSHNDTPLSIEETEALVKKLYGN